MNVWRGGDVGGGGDGGQDWVSVSDERWVMGGNSPQPVSIRKYILAQHNSYTSMYMTHDGDMAGEEHKERGRRDMKYLGCV